MTTLVSLIPFAIFLSILLTIFWRFYTKAGKPGWVCLLPIYNVLVLADIAKVSRSKVWKAMAAYLVGWIIYAYTMYTTYANILASNGENANSIAIGSFLFIASFIIALIFMFPVYKGIALNFGQGAGFAWGLMFLNVIFFGILAFSSAKYVENDSFTDNDILDAEI